MGYMNITRYFMVLKFSALIDGRRRSSSCKVYDLEGIYVRKRSSSVYTVTIRCYST